MDDITGKMIGPLGLIGKGIAKVFLFASKSWWLVFTLIILSSAIIGSINEGVEQNDWSIPFKDLGLFLVLSDEKLYEGTQELDFEIIEKENFIGKIGSYFDFGWYILKNLFSPIWMILFNFILFYKIFLYILGDDSKKLRATIVSLSIMVFLQILVSGVPFRGTYNLIKFVIITIGA